MLLFLKDTINARTYDLYNKIWLGKYVVIW